MSVYKLNKSKAFCSVSDEQTLVLVAFDTEDVFIIKCAEPGKLEQMLLNSFDPELIRCGSGNDLETLRLFEKIIVSCSDKSSQNTDAFTAENVMKVQHFEHLKLNQFIPQDLVAVMATDTVGTLAQSEEATSGGCVDCG
ncbi:MAG: hypothetical protein HY606_09720 [Planctomycetes bacterium]|nr:hypothetical protein [Planctomycetota bacterium]